MADFNGDGKPDIAVANILNSYDGIDTVSVFLGDGRGGFTAAPGSPFNVGNNPWSIAVGDFNHDGKLDLAVANDGAFSGRPDTISILLGDGRGGFAPAPGSPISLPPNTGPLAVAVADFNNDGNLDLVTANLHNSTVSVFLGNGNGTFTLAAGSPVTWAVSDPWSVAVADFNGDGNIDVVVGTYGYYGAVLLGDGTGRLTLAPGSPFSAGPMPERVAVGDFNRDGKPDLAFANWDIGYGWGNVTVLLGNGDGSFRPSNNGAFDVGHEISTVVAADFNMDGNLDIAAVTDYDGLVTLLLGDGNGGFTPAPGSPFSVASFSNWAVAADIDGNGTPDLVVSGGTILLNQTKPLAFNVPLAFVPVTPCRIADTRITPDGPFAGPNIAGKASRDFSIPQSSCGIPATALAYSLNVTVDPHGQHMNYITVWPTGAAQPLASTLNSVDGRVKANAAIVPVGYNGAVSIYASDATDIILDIDGYFVDEASNPTALAYYPLTPCRVLDTRNANGTLGGPSLAANSTRDFPILAAASCSIPPAAQAYSLNFSVSPKVSDFRYLTTWPAGAASQPPVSTLNAVTGAITANAAIVPAGTNGDINVYVTDATDLWVDIDGYLAPPGAGGLSLYSVQPCRVLDTRNPSGAQPFSGEKDVNVMGSGCGVPASAQAYVLNATVDPAGALNYLTLWPQGETQPLASTLNAMDGQYASNMAIVPTSNGSISAFAYSATHLILDISAYFAP